MAIAEFEERSDLDDPFDRQTVNPSIDAFTNVELLDRFFETGDSHLFGMLCERYKQAMDQILLREGTWNAQEREDIIQDAFLKAFDKIDQLREIHAFGGWLRTIVHTTAINKGTRGNHHRHIPLEHRGKAGGEETAMDVEDAGVGTPEEDALRNELVSMVRKAMKELKPLDRLMAKQFYLQEMSLKEMSAKNDVPIGTIKRRLHTVRQRLKPLLTEYADDSLNA